MVLGAGTGTAIGLRTVMDGGEGRTLGPGNASGVAWRVVFSPDPHC